MAGCVVPEFVYKFKWAKPGAREVIQDGSNCQGRFDNTRFKCVFQSIRVLKEDDEKDKSQFTSTREKTRVSSAQNSHKKLRNGKPLEEAVASLISRANQGIGINPHGYIDVLQSLSESKDIDFVKQLHECIKKSRLEENSVIANNLLKSYIGCGRVQSAQDVFNKLLNKTIVSWNIMIGACAANDQAEDAIKLYKRLRNEGGQPNAVTYLSVLKACASPIALKWGRDIHAHILRDGLQADIRVGTALVSMYAKCGSIVDARTAFDKMEKRNLICWNVMIGGLAKHGRGHEAFSLFLQMQREGLKPDMMTFVSILNPCSSSGALEWVKEVHAQATKARLDVELRVGTALVQMYAKSGSIEAARVVFGRMEKRDAISWNMMIAGLAEHGLGHEAFSSFLQMQREGFRPNPMTYVCILNPCSSTGALEWVKGVHAHAIKAGLDVNLRVGNALVHMYAKSGSIEDARSVFDRMAERNVISWTVMIGGLAQHGFGHEAFSLFLQMKERGFTPDSFTFLSILNPLSSTGALEWVKVVHTHAMKAGLDVDLRVGNALAHMYSKSGSVEDARKVFDKLERRDVISWNMMIGGLAQHGRGHEAFSLFLQMDREGFVPDWRTYVSILNPCSSAGALEWVKEVHSHAMKAGLDVDLRVGTALVHMYTKSGSIGDARVVFGKMEKRDVVSWNVMIGGLAENGLGAEAFTLFLQMEQGGVIPDSFTYVSILDPCSSAGALEWVREVHVHARKAGLDVGLRVGNALVHMYAKSGSIEDARVVFDRMKERDRISWNLMIGGLAQHGLGLEGFSLFLQMEREGFIPDTLTYLSILNPCSSAGALEWVKEVHAHATKARLNVDLRVGTALIHMYLKIGRIEDARVVFDKMEERDVISWNMMIGGLAQHGSIEDARALFDRMKKRDLVSWNLMIGGLAQHELGYEAFSLFLQMEREGFTPDSITYLSILNPCSSAGSLEWVKEVQAHATKAGLDVDLRVGNALVHMYGKTGSIADARQVFDKMLERDVVSWNAMMGALAQNGFGREAQQLFEDMKLKGVKPSGPSFVAVLSACSHVGLVDEGRFLFVSLKRDFGIEPALEHHNCMVDIYGRAGLLEEAKLFILGMPVEPNVATWGAFLAACRMYKNIELAEVAANECMELEPLNPSPYILLSNIHAAAGNWDQVSTIRSMMRDRGIRKDPGRCWIEVGNKVHHFVVGDTSHPESSKIYATLNSLFEQLKTEGYNPDTRLVLRNIDEEDKEVALCSHSERLAIAYGLMHVPPGKPVRIFKNLRICTDCHTASKLISRTTGREIVARDAIRFHHFNDGVCSCGDYW